MSGGVFSRLLVPVFKNAGERSTAKNYHPVSLLSVVSKVFEKLVNNRIVDHLQKCGLFLISSMVLGLLDQLQIFSQLYLIELLGIFVRSYLSCSSWCIQGFWHGLASWSPQTLGLWCFRSDIWHYFYFFFSNRQIQVVLDGLYKNIQLMQEFLKAPFLLLPFSYYTLMTFLMMLSVILLFVLMMVLSSLSVIRHLICSNN